MATSSDNAAHQIVIQYCFEGDLNPVQTKREIETIERHMCPGHWYTPGTKYMDGWSGEPIEESRGSPTKRNEKNQVMDVIREDRYLTVQCA